MADLSCSRTNRKRSSFATKHFQRKLLKIFDLHPLLRRLALFVARIITWKVRCLVTDTQTDTHTDTQTNTVTLAAHTRGGLKSFWTKASACSNATLKIPTKHDGINNTWIPSIHNFCIHIFAVLSYIAATHNITHSLCTSKCITHPALPTPLPPTTLWLKMAQDVEHEQCWVYMACWSVSCVVKSYS